jgi:hypothetical protein
MAVQTGNPIAGIATYFALGSATTPSVVDDISDFLDGVEPTEDVDELDGTTFRNAQKRIVPGFRATSYSLSGKWSASAHAFFSPLRGTKNVSYEYGPEGNAGGMTKITGTCNVLNYSGPVAAQDAITTFTVELRVNTQADATYVLATGATAGTPGSFTPAGSAPRANLAGMTGCTAIPATAWTTGQHVVMGDLNKAYWNGTTWMAGQAP